MRSMRTPQLGGNDDNALIEAFRLGDQRAGNALFRKYEPYLKRACRKFGREHDWLNAGDLDGAANEAFAQALKNYDPTRGRFRAYLPKHVAGAARKVHTPDASSPAAVISRYFNAVTFPLFANSLSFLRNSRRNVARPLASSTAKCSRKVVRSMPITPAIASSDVPQATKRTTSER
jgi:Sigma-70 region 2